MKKSTIFLIISIVVFFVSLGIMYFYYSKTLSENQELIAPPEKVLSPAERREEMQNFLNTIAPTTTEAIQAAEENAKQMQSFLDTLNTPPKENSPSNSVKKQATSSPQSN